MTNFILAFLVSSLLIAPLIFLNIRIAPRWGLIDWPKSRGVAQDQIPIVGYSLVAATLLILCVMAALGKVTGWIVASSAIIAFMGHLDDRRPIPAIEKLFFQVLASSAVVWGDPLVREAIIIPYGNFGGWFATFFIVGLTNAVNFIDGIDGLAGMVLCFGAFSFISIADGARLGPYTSLSASVIGMLVVFLYVNIKLRKGFLGNIGSYFFSFLLAVFHLSDVKEYSNILSHVSVIGLCFLVPIADSIMVSVSRVLSKRSPMNADKSHFHHRLMQTSLPLRWVLLCFGFIELSSVVTAYTIDTHLENERALLPWMIGMTQLSLTVVLLLFLDFASKDRVSSFFKTMNQGSAIYFLRYQILAKEMLSPSVVRRIQSKIESEIRISDHCYFEGDSIIHVILRVDPERLKSIMNRLTALLNAEGYECDAHFEYGEYRRTRLTDVSPLQRIA